jgi:hypothetical protein
MKLVKHLCLILAFLCALPIAALAQTAAGSISGTVTDPNGALVPGATVVATHVPTGRQYTQVTTQAGLYVFANLPTGPYTLSVKQAGFKVYVQSGIEVRVDLRETIDIKLTLGTVQQTVEVRATAPVLETANATRGVGISPQTMMTLPLWNGSLELANGFIGYMPGVTSNGEQSINGSIGRASELLIDGTSIVIPESGGTNFEFPGFYAFSEMKLVTSGFTAENGRVGGGIQEYVTKSGTNAVHGAAFFNFKRDIFDAVPFQTNAILRTQTAINNGTFTCGYPGVLGNHVCRPKERFNEEGGYAGGPVYIPHVYDGRNRTFFFFTWTGFWQPAAISTNTNETVPTAAMLQGNFQNYVTSAGAMVPIYDPNTTNSSGIRTAFANNIIPTNRISAIATAIGKAIPPPNAGAAGAVAANYVYNSQTINLYKVWSIKIDHSIHTRNRISFFMTHRADDSWTDQYMPGPLSNGLHSFQLPFHENASDDFIINPHMVLHTVWGFHQDRNYWYNPLQNTYGSKFGFTNLATGTNQDATPYIHFINDLLGNPTDWGMNQGKVNNGSQNNWTTQVAQTLTWIHAKHEFRMGWDIRRLRTIGNDWATTNGSYVFNRLQTALSATDKTSGSAFASFLLGQADSGSQGVAPPYLTPGVRYGYHAGFFQDTWRIRPKFTLNLGVRYEVPIGWHIVTGDYSSFSPTVVDPSAGNLPGGLLFMGSGPGRIGASRPYPTDFSDIGPRLGFAWNVRPSVVVRGAWGIFYETLGNGGCGCADGFGGSFSQSSDGFNPAFQWDATSTTTAGVHPPATFRTPPVLDPGFDNFNNSGMYMMGPHYGKAPRIYDYNLTLQKEYKNWLFEGAYVGVRSYGLNSSPYINSLPTTELRLGTAGPSTDPNMLQALAATWIGTDAAHTPHPYDANLCIQTSTYTPRIGCTNGVPNVPFPTFSGWNGSGALNQAIRPFPQYGVILSANSGDGRNWFDSFQFKVEHRFGNLNMESSYVWEKIMNIGSYRQIFSQGSQQGFQDAYNLKADKSRQIEDMPHVINILLSYRLPYGKGQRWLSNTNPIVNHVIGNWTFAMDGQYRSGALIQIANPTNYLSAETFATLTKATATGLPIKTNTPTNSLDPNNSAIRRFNTGANAGWKQTPAFTLGNFSYYNNQVRQPWIRSENISLNKQFKMWESVLLNYQINVFNPFQRTDFSLASATVTAANFGQAGGPQVGARAITMGLRLEF